MRFTPLSIVAVVPRLFVSPPPITPYISARKFITRAAHTHHNHHKPNDFGPNMSSRQMPSKLEQAKVMLAARIRTQRQFEAFVEARMPGGTGTYDKAMLEGEQIRALPQGRY